MAIKNFFESLFVSDSFSNDKLYVIETAQIIGQVSSQSGVIQELKLNKGAQFKEIQLVGKPTIKNVKRGANLVMQDLDIAYANAGVIKNMLEQVRENKGAVSILHINSKKEAFLYGEHKGLFITELTDTQILLEGSETDVFFQMSPECAGTLTTFD